MWKKKSKIMKNLLIILISLTLIYCCFSCKDDVKKGRTTFPDIIVRTYQFVDKKQFSFTIRTPYGVTIDDFDENNIYSYTDVMFRGWVDANIIQINDQQIQKDVTNYLYNNYPDYIENVEVGFIREKLKSIKIYSDKDFNGVKAGSSLNKYFVMNSRLVQYRKAKYVLFDGDILEAQFNINTFIPAWFDLKLKVRPNRSDIYNFFVEMETEENQKFVSKIISIKFE